ncbi:MAG: DNA polymerase III subunit beta [Gammaproteobacteria bacterium]|nr:DNA polymerase III subunit beta [Gammaproteobacteria bacterium]
MKFVTTKEAMLRPLQQVAGVVERRQTLPVLANVLISATEDCAELTGTDLEVELTASVPLQVEDPSKVTVPARKLLDIWRQLPETAEVALSLDDEKVVVRAGRFRSALSTLPATDYPRPELSAPEVSMDLAPGELRRLMDQTSFAMAQQDVRFFLNGMLFEFGPTYVRTVATDGHRLATASVMADVGGGVLKQVIVPRKGVSELQRLLGDVESETVRVEIGASHLRATADGVAMTTKLIDGRFPDYDRVIPRGGDIVAVIDKADFAGMLARIAILSNEKYRAVRVLLSEGSLSLSARNAEHEAAEESMPIDFDGPDSEVGFNAVYLQDALGGIGGAWVRVVLHSNGSAVIEDPDAEDALYVIMPMKL